MRSEVRVRSTPASMSMARAAVPADNKVSCCCFSELEGKNSLLNAISVSE